mmetsp:Transcript_10583/g.14701  ORF Transcript_10583/g.14701 Transcript_10583/m.14701 type:complete len:97 (-) Transcript_10583:73-363(-)
MQFPTANQQRVSTRSWHEGDIDILVPRKSLVHLHGPARDAWKHGIRIGIDPRIQLQTEQTFDKHGAKLWDWFGNARNLVERNNERYSIVFAFEDPK